jgi:thiamine-monophosphate kinase
LPNEERALIQGIRRLAGGSRSPAVVEGIGDDCAILKIAAGHELLVTTDLCVEDVHFRRNWHPAPSVGHRCLTRGLSDIAAMGGEPVACFLSLGLPTNLAQSWVDGFLLGFEKLARRSRVALAGGDISGSRKIVADIVVVGQVPRGKAIRRSGARAGDRIYVTGELGGSGAALRRLYAGDRLQAKGSSRHFFPQPRLQVGQWLRRRGLATSMIDVSDGLSVDLLHICEESGVDAVIESAAVPVASGAPLELALDSGDDYELIFTARPKTKVPSRIEGIKITEIGTVHASAREPGSRSHITMRDEAGKSRPVRATGWQHFAKKK